MMDRYLPRCAAMAAALALLAAAAAGASAAEPLVLKSRVELAGPELRLSDLFAGLPAEADRAVANAPALGETIELDARWLYALARSRGIDWRPASTRERSVVVRLSRTIGAAEVEAALEPALAIQGAPDKRSILLDNPSIALRLPVHSTGELQVSQLTYDSAGGRFQARLVAQTEGQAPVKASVSGRVLRLSDMPVLRRRVRPGDIITADDIEWRTQRSDRIPPQALLDSSELVGLTPRRVLRAGEPVRAGSLRPPVLVAKNTLVTLRLATERMVLTAQGRALEDGGHKQVIRVINTQSKVIVSGIVTAEGAVTVAQPHGQP